MKSSDFLIIGAGMAGASVAYELAAAGSVMLLERESQPGYHTTGRSAAQFAESYGNTLVRRLTRASRSFYDNPPDGFAEHELLSARGALFIARDDQLGALQALRREVDATASGLSEVTSDAIVRQVPVLRRAYAAAGLYDPSSMDIDVHALHQGYLRGLRHRGGEVVVNADVTGIARDGAGWSVATRAATWHGQVLVNAAGAWADEVASLAGAGRIGLVPKRRTVITFDAPQETDPRHWPLVIDVDETFYFKPESGRILASPADETPSPPCDAQPEEIDIAILIDRLQQATMLQPRRIASKWAGLRSFVPDKSPVAGFAPDMPGFFWLAGQGGYGIQMAPALARAAAAMATGGDMPDDIGDLGIRSGDLSPARLKINLRSD